MLKAAIVSIIALFGIQAGAATPFEIQMTNIAREVSAPVNAMSLLDWKVGDSNDYNLKGGILNGKMHVEVREEVAEGFWIQQDMDLGFMGKQVIEILYDKDTGKVLKLIVNGKEETPPEQGDMEVIDQRNESITVPKGQFDCIYVKIRSKKDNKESEAWLNPYLIPISGMVKTISPSQMGKITVELTDYRKQ